MAYDQQLCDNANNNCTLILAWSHCRKRTSMFHTGAGLLQPHRLSPLNGPVCHPKSTAS